MKPSIKRINVADVMSSVIKYGSHILFGAGIVIMAYLSFVAELDVSPSLQNVSIIALISMVLNYMIWDSYYQLYYNKVMAADIDNNSYSIHRRYYNARKGWQYADLQGKIRTYNQDFTKAWLDDVIDITGFPIDDKVVLDAQGNKIGITRGLRNGPYKGRPHKWLIWRIKHNKYPKSGIKTPRDVQQVLRVGRSSGVGLRTRASEQYHGFNRVKKLALTVLSTFLAASLIYEFIEQAQLTSALLQMLLHIAILFMSFFFGSISGNRGAQIKLGVAEEISELLESWKNEPCKEEPYTYVDEQDVPKEVVPDAEPVSNNPISIDIT